MTGQRIKVVVTDKQRVAQVAILGLSATDGQQLPNFSAGAHIEIAVTDGIVRQYSLCNSTRDNNCYRIAVLKETESRGGSKTIYDQVDVGRELFISQPKNLFSLSDTQGLQVLVAGGIGITPILAMAYELRASSRPFEIHYCFSNEQEAAFVDELRREFPEQLNLHESKQARFDPLLTFSSLPSDSSLYTCGPNGFMTWVMEAARAAGLAESNIHFEQFSAEVEISGDAFEVYCSASDRTVQIASDQSIATALNAAGIKVDVSCEQGICGTCITDVVEGEPDHRDQFLTDEEKQDNDQMALCCSRAKTARLVIDI